MVIYLYGDILITTFTRHDVQIPLEPHEITVDDDLREAAKQVEV